MGTDPIVIDITETDRIGRSRQLQQRSTNYVSPASVEALVVSYNSGEDLRAALTTFARHHQGNRHYEAGIAVWDNASPDGSASLVREQFPDARLVCSPTNIGFGQAVNALAASSEADYLLLLNPDLVFDRDIIEALLQGLRGDPDAFAAGPGLRYPDGTPQHSAQELPDLATDLVRLIAGTKAERLIPHRRRRSATQRGLPPDGPTRVDFLWATCWLVRRSDALAFGPFDDRFPLYDEDVDLCLRLRDAGRSLLYVPDVQVTHVGGASSTPKRKADLMFRARCTFYRVHRGRGASLTYATAYRVVGRAKQVTSRYRLRRAARSAA